MARCAARCAGSILGMSSGSLLWLVNLGLRSPCRPTWTYTGSLRTSMASTSQTVNASDTRANWVSSGWGSGCGGWSSWLAGSGGDEGGQQEYTVATRWVMRPPGAIRPGGVGWIMKVSGARVEWSLVSRLLLTPHAGVVGVGVVEGDEGARGRHGSAWSRGGGAGGGGWGGVGGGGDGGIVDVLCDGGGGPSARPAFRSQRMMASARNSTPCALARLLTTHCVCPQCMKTMACGPMGGSGACR